MLNPLALFTYLSHRINANLQVAISPFLSDDLIRFLGFDPLRGEGYIRDQQQRTTSDDIVVADDKDRCGLHVDADTGQLLQFLPKRLVVLLDTSIGRVNYARSVLVTEIENFLGNKFM